MTARTAILELFQRNQGPIPYSFSIGDGTAPDCVVLGSIHGNEPAGAEVLYSLYEQRHNIHGSVLFVLGNPDAYRADRRYLDRDLNRLFGAPIQGDTIEDRRGRELQYLLQQVSATDKKPFIVDLHTMSIGQEPACICRMTDAEAVRMASRLSLLNTIILFDVCVIGSLGLLAQAHALPYIAVECGQHMRPESKERGLQAVQILFTQLGIWRTTRETPNDRKTFLKIEEQIRVAPGLRFTLPELHAVTPVFAGDVYAVDDAGARVARTDGALFCPSGVIQSTDADAGLFCSYLAR